MTKAQAIERLAVAFAEERRDMWMTAKATNMGAPTLEEEREFDDIPAIERLVDELIALVSEPD